MSRTLISKTTRNEFREIRLAVNAAFTLCEFLLESIEYQQNKDQRQAS